MLSLEVGGAQKMKESIKFSLDSILYGFFQDSALDLRKRYKKHFSKSNVDYFMIFFVTW